MGTKRVLTADIIRGLKAETNYISTGDAEASGSPLQGWVAYANTAQATPVNGTGGTPTVTFATSTDSSLVGAQNFLFTKTAVNSQGQGFSYPFTIDAGYQSKPLSVSLLYSVASGTYADGDMTVWLYDVTNGVLIQPSGSTIQNVLGAATKKLEFQTNSNSTSYRLIFHVASTSALAYSLRFDNFSVAPNTTTSGAVITDWVAYTPTITGFGTPTSVDVKSRRVGGSLEVQGRFTSGTPTAVQAAVTLGYGGVNGGLTTSSSIDSAGQVLGTGAFGQATPTQVTVIAVPSSSTVGFGAQSSTTAGTNFANGSALSASGNTFEFFFSVAIQGWGTSQVLSSDTATNVVAAIYNTSGSVTLTGGSPINFATLTQDTNGAVTVGASWKFTAPVPGFYQVDTTLSTTSVSCGLDLYKNGSLFKRFGWINNTTYGGNGTLVYLNAGEYIDLRPGTSGTLATDNLQSISIFRLSGPAQIAASEKVVAVVTGTPATWAANGIVIFPTVQKDSHGGYSASTGRYTVGTPGDFNISAFVNFNNGPGIFYVTKNGTTFANLSQSASSLGAAGSLIVPNCVAGDILDVRSVNSGGTPASSTLSINRI